MPEDTGQGHHPQLGREPDKPRLPEKVTFKQITRGEACVHLFILLTVNLPFFHFYLLLEQQFIYTFDNSVSVKKL